MSSLLGIHSNRHRNPGFLSFEESYSYFNWIHNYYGNPNRLPRPKEKLQKLFITKIWLSYKEFVDFIEPYYR